MAIDVLVIPVIVAAACGLPIGGLARPLAVLSGLLIAATAAASAWFGVGGGPIEAYVWAGPLGARFAVGADGFSAALLMLTGVAFAAGAAVSGSTDRPRAYFALWSVLQAAVAGVLVARDLVLFVACWEGLLVPLALLLLGWGGAERRPAARRLVLSWLVADALLLAGVVALGVGTRTFAISDLAGYRLAAGSQIAFAALLLTPLAMRLPLFPLHGWLPPAAVAAPAPVALVLVAVVPKLALYGIARVAVPLFPRGVADLAPALISLAAVGALYGALIATRQRDTRRLIAYASVSQLDLIALGVLFATPEGTQGALLAGISHGLATAALVILATAVARRVGTFEVGAGGLAARAPVLLSLCVIAILAFVAIPGTAGGAGEILILAAAFARSPGVGLVAVVTGVVAAAYGSGLIRTAFFGPRPEPALPPADADWLERVVVIPLLVLLIGAGVAPRLLTDLVAR